MIIDKYGFVRSGTDAGDSCQRTHSVWLLLQLLLINNVNYRTALSIHLAYDNHSKEFEVNPGIYVRNPEPMLWTDDPSNVTRDQLTPVMCLLAVSSYNGNTESRTRLTNLLIACLKRGMFAQNTHDGVSTDKWKVPDFITPDLWAIIARGYMKSWLAPIALPFVLLGDAFSILTSLVKVFIPRTDDNSLAFVWNDPNSTDDSNINNTIMTSQYIFPTLLSWIARKIYKTFRKQNNGNIQLHENSAIMGAIAWTNHNDNPEITEMSRYLVERY